MQAALLIAQTQFNATNNNRHLEMRLIGTCLSALYQASTCHRKCHNNGHVLEALAGRAHNLGAAAIDLARGGFYDEALNLIRGIGEIANLIAALAVNKEALRDWLASTPETRRKKFGPGKIRDMLRKNGAGFPILADTDWYSRLCESYTHVTPKTRPGAHGRDSKDWVGPVFQKQGADSSISELAGIIAPLAAMICAYFKFDDLFAEIESLIGEFKSEPES